MKTIKLMMCVGIILHGSCAFAQTPEPNSASAPSTYQVRIKIKSYGTNERFPATIEVVNGVLVIPVQVAGQSGWAVLDNGLSESMIDTRFARQAIIALGPIVSPAKTPNGYIERRRTLGYVSVVVPGQAEFSAPFSVIDLSVLSKVSRRPVILGIGNDYFSNLSFLFSQSRKTVDIAFSGQIHPQGDVEIIEFEKNTSKIPVSVNGKKLLLTLDLGFNGGIALSDSAWSRTFTSGEPEKELFNVGLDGRVIKVKSVVAKGVSAGNYSIKELDVRKGSVVDQSDDGKIGVKFFGRSDFLIDIKSGRIVIGSM